MPSRRDTVIILIAAVVIAVLAWAFLARDESSAPTAPPGGLHQPAPLWPAAYLLVYASSPAGLPALP